MHNGPACPVRLRRLAAACRREPRSGFAGQLPPAERPLSRQLSIMLMSRLTGSDSGHDGKARRQGGSGPKARRRGHQPAGTGPSASLIAEA
ncbi:MAG TPA: hypothetical protein DEH11_22895, partial [Actinobacteria bacterium]|nr:hypothetical protein [Actinomycetota bacterium]